ncbi:MAG: hypothetical protein A4E38_00112 [Methanoregulaceae archaeon PtaB.Bin108]|nr:MAG: hypothetical protein A4E38_00112 [Methanoregulaceae archaeon PtaB.Bin108]
MEKGCSLDMLSISESWTLIRSISISRTDFSSLSVSSNSRRSRTLTLGISASMNSFRSLIAMILWMSCGEMVPPGTTASLISPAEGSARNLNMFRIFVISISSVM